MMNKPTLAYANVLGITGIAKVGFSSQRFSAAR